MTKGNIFISRCCIFYQALDVNNDKERSCGLLNLRDAFVLLLSCTPQI